MKNIEIARIFYEIADILEMQNVQWKPQAYRKAARSIEALSEDIEDIYRKGGIKALEEIPGVGEKLANKIEEYIKTGKIHEYDRLKKTVPEHIDRLMKIPGIGPKTAQYLFEELGVHDIKTLLKAVKQHKVAGLKGMGIKSEEDMLRGIMLLKQSKERMLLGLALPIVNEIVGSLKKLKEIDKISAAGSVRRMKETIRDLDILVTSNNPAKVMDYFTNMKGVTTVLSKGPTRSSIVMGGGLQVDVRVVNDDCFGSALQYFTGSKEHNIKLRQIAIKKGCKLSEYGLFDKKTGERLAGNTEEEVYKKLGMQYIEPEMRENMGEIEAAIKSQLPKLIGYNDVNGDLHVHSNHTDGAHTIQQMAEYAKKMGYKYIAITDHSFGERIAHGLSADELLKEIKEIRKVSSKLKGIEILAGSEINIDKNGDLDYTDDVLKKLDVVIAAVHSGFKSSKEVMTKRILKGLDNKYVNIFAHPLGRKIGLREPYAVDVDKLFKVCKENKIALEINSFPERLDLPDTLVKQAVEKGIKLSLGTDAHAMKHLELMNLGIAVARRGWATKKDIINTYSLDELKKFLKRT